MLETWAPKSISMIISCLSTITGTSLECPTKHAMGSGLRKGIEVTSGCPFLWATFIVAGLVWGQGWNAGGLLLAVAAGASGGWATFPQFPLDRFKVLAGVAHSQAMWPQPWHLKLWRKLVSFLFQVPSLDPCMFGPWPLVVVVPMPCLTDALQSGAVCLRPVRPLWELG